MVCVVMARAPLEQEAINISSFFESVCEDATALG